MAKKKKAKRTPPTHHINNASSQNQSRASSEEMTEVPDFNPGSINKDSPGRECTMLDADCQKEPLVDENEYFKVSFEGFVLDSRQKMEIRVTAAAPFPLNNLSAANLDIRILDGGINQEEAPGQKPTLR